MNNYFKGLIGQNAVKSKLSFYLDAFYKTSQAPFLLMAGAKGLGKTEFAKSFAKNLCNTEGDKRAFLEINCSTIKNNDQFFEQIFLPLIIGTLVMGIYPTVFLNSIHFSVNMLIELMYF